MMKRPQILVPPPAVLKNGEPDAQGMDRYFNWMADHGVDGLFINGSTGEFTILTDDQKVETVRIARECAGDRLYLIAGAITGSAELTCRLAGKGESYDFFRLYAQHKKRNVSGYQLICFAGTGRC